MIDHLRFNRFKNIVNAAMADGLTDKIKIIMAADHNKFGVSGEFINPGHQLDPVAGFHHHIHDDQCRLLLAYQFNGFVAVPGLQNFPDLMGIPVDQKPDRLPDSGFVVYNQRLHMLSLSTTMSISNRTITPPAL
ncbi:hypothetical protein D3C76_172260 [compost metagenome]